MTVLKVLAYPDPRLRTRALPVDHVDDDVRRLAADLLETMYAGNAVGLAATQVDVHRRVIAIDVSAEKNDPLILINPEILARDTPALSEESCLSVPGWVDLVARANHVRVRALDREGQPVELDATGLLAVCIQHELDHLEGRLFVDRLSWFKRTWAQWQLKKRLGSPQSGAQA